MADKLTKLSPQQLNQLRGKFPFLPEDYFEYMSSIGWGETDSGRMIYEGPTHVADVYGQRSSLRDVLLLGDDFQGYCFGFNHSSGRYGEVSDAGKWEEWQIDRGIRYYVADKDESVGM